MNPNWAEQKRLESIAVKVMALNDTTEATVIYLQSLTKQTAPIFFGTRAQHRLHAIGARFAHKDGWYHCSVYTLQRHLVTIEKDITAQVAKKLLK